MPQRKDIETILIIGSGPIVVGQACEFDYSGTQAIRALKGLGYRVVLLNSNPATIMTDPGLADATYIEPLTVGFLERVIVKEKPQAMLATLGGQTALNLALQAHKNGILARYGVELIGADARAIEKAEDRQLFKEAMAGIGLATAKSVYVKTLQEGLDAARDVIGLPLVIRPSFTLGGLGSAIVYSKDDLRARLESALELSPVHEVLIEEYLHHWKEFELELMRDVKGNQSVVAAIENLDPMGVHTGDSITVCPTMTLSDREYQAMRDAAFAAYEALGIACGGSNVQFALEPKTGRMVVIEINPRVSRSSALASKATGFPIAKIAAMLAVGMTLDEIPNDITGKTLACFEPTLDYVVVKIPRFHFEKFPMADTTLTSQMKSIGEVMAIGRSFLEALQKGLRSLEIGHQGLTAIIAGKDELLRAMAKPSPVRLDAVYGALLQGFDIAEIYRISGIDPWFLREIAKAAGIERRLRKDPRALKAVYQEARSMGFSCAQLTSITQSSRKQIDVLEGAILTESVFYEVDTCAGEFEAKTPYFYSTQEKEMGTGYFSLAKSSLSPFPRKSVVILGSGPNRIGQGIEFDYTCVHAAWALRDEGYDAVMVNCNPETVSTDYDT